MGPWNPLKPSTGPVTLHFKDGSSATCDVLVGCDGIKSTVRKQMLTDHVSCGGGDHALLDLIEPVWTGTIAYRGLIPVERLRTPDGREHRSVQRPMMVCHPIRSLSSQSVEITVISVLR